MKEKNRVFMDINTGFPVFKKPETIELNFPKISGGYNSLSVSDKQELDKKLSGDIIDEAIETLKSIRMKRVGDDVKYGDLIKAFGTLVDLHRKIEGKDVVQNNVQVNISISDFIKKQSEKIIDIDKEET